MNDKNLELLNDFVIEPDKYVYSFNIKEKNKIRNMITYNKGINFGQQLKEIHYKVARLFEDNFCDRNEYSFAYHKNTSCKDAIEDHLKSSYFIKIDIHHFFESITADLFFKLYGERFNNKWKKIIEGCFYKKNLCIGFVTSPIISDFFMSKFDNSITNYLKNNNKLHYSRYSDDILISSEEDEDQSLNDLLEFIKNELKLLGLEINNKKTKKVRLDYESHNSISFLGLNISKLDSINNKITISKRYILHLLFLIEKSNRYNNSCKELLNEINSRVAYLAYNSPISFNKFQKKHINKFGVTYNFVPKKLYNRKVPATTDEILDWDKYTKDFIIDIHTKVVNDNNKEVVLNDSVQLLKYIGEDSEVIIPPFVDSIAPNAFAHKSFIRKVILNDNIRSIGNKAFNYCSNLSEIELPNSLVYIGDSAFSMCNSLKSINIPKKVKIINANTFSDSGLEKINFSEGLKIIKQSAFSYCRALRTLELPDTLETLEKDAFLNCTLLTEVKFPNSLISIPERCFENCNSLKEINFSDSILSIEANSFSYCSLLKNVYIPKNLINIDSKAFSNCNNLVSISVDSENKVYDSRNNCNALIETKTNTLLITTKNTTLEEGIEIIGACAYKDSDISNIFMPDTVKKIGDNAFQNCQLLKKIQLSKNIEYIGEFAFENCISLKDIVIPKKVNLIKESTFSGCYRLININLPENITSIESKAFENNKALKNINIPLLTKEIGYKAFGNCYSIKELKIPASTSKISPYAFSGCSKNLESIIVDSMNTTYDSRNNCNALIETKTNELIIGCKNTIIEEGIISIADFAFAYCKDIEKVIMPNSMTKIGKKAFIDCKSLKYVNLNKVNNLKNEVFLDCKALEKVDLPNSLVSIGTRCFCNCYLLKKAFIPESIIYLGNYAFANCKALRSIFIPKNYTNFDKTLFDGCESIKEIIVDENNPVYDSRENCNAIITNDDKLIFACNNTVIPKTVRVIGEKAFSNCQHLSYVEIPNNVKIIETEAFARCKALKNIKFGKTKIILEDKVFAYCENINNIEIPKNINRISNSMFYGCKSLKNIALHDSIKYIGEGAFANTSIRSINIPKSVKIIHKSTFENCINLEEVYIHDKVKSILNAAFSGCIKLKNIVLPESVTKIDSSVFKNDISLKKVELPKNIKIISNDLFNGCISLKDVVIPNNVKVISKAAFYNCKSLKNINLPNQLNIIGSDAFANNLLLKKIILPSSIKVFNNSAFKNCTNIESIIVEKGNKILTSRNSNVIIEEKTNTVVLGCQNSVIPNGVTSIADSAFAYCDKLSKIVLPETITKIKPCAFAHCTNLKKINFPNSLKEIGRKAFVGCNLLEEIFIPNSVEIIYEDSFENSSNSLEKIIVEEDNLNYTSENGSNSIISKDTNTLILGCKNTIIPDIVENIGTYAFSNNNFLENINIPTSVKQIGRCAFKNCLSLKNIHIPYSVLSVFATSFVGCKNLEAITVDPNNPVYRGGNNGNAIIKIDTNALILGCKKTIIPNGVIAISQNAFEGVCDMEYLFIPKSVKTSLNYIFKDCNKLKTIIVDEDNPIYDSRNNCNAIIKSINNELVLGCKNTTMPVNINSIGMGAFEGCDGLEKLYIPKDVFLIDVTAFKDCNNIVSIVVDPENKVYDSRNNCNAIISTKSNKLVLSCKKTILPKNIIKKKYIKKIYDKYLDFCEYVSEKSNQDSIDFEEDCGEDFYDDLPF